ncbi:hypothetical protein [Streptomyces sp. NPDC002790]|uniref:hypothetical protein n=1 Tax=Streptomyces sp. NPDC002790 TaxID=3154431 RepID=UPI003323C18D
MAGGGRSTPGERGAEGVLRPQSLMLTFLGNYVLGGDACVYSGNVIEVFGRTGVGEHATRSTLTRMVGRGLLQRRREGRRMYFALTDRAEAILRDGEDRIWKQGAVNDGWDGTWTLLAFSLPEAGQRRRHDLRSQLTWAGFGPLIGGLGTQSARFQNDYWHHTVEATRPDLVIPVHWDDFGRPLTKRPRPVPRILDNFAKAKALLDRKSAESGIAVRFQQPYETITPFG